VEPSPTPEPRDSRKQYIEFESGDSELKLAVPRIAGENYWLSWPVEVRVASVFSDHSPL
jgi:hypothetical protein